MEDEAAPAAPLRADEAVDARPPPVRLVAARIADDILPPPPPAPAVDVEVDAPNDVLPPVRAATCWLPPPKLAVRVPPSRPKPLRLPRIWGTVKDTKRSAPVVPASRIVFSSLSVLAVAVRTIGPAVPEVSCLADCSPYQAPAPISARTNSPHIHRRPGSRGSTGAAGGGTILGDGGKPGCCGPGDGSGLGEALDTDIEVS